MPFATAELPHEPLQSTADFYTTSLRVLQEANVPFLIGGAYALHAFTGITRPTKDLDIFIRPDDIEPALAVLARETGCRAEVTIPHWLAKLICGDVFLDVIFNSGNGVARVDDEWFEHASAGIVLGVPVLLCPPEETLWSKAFVMERERFDGADVAHLLLACGPTLDWDRLLRRFGDHWRVLYAHIVMFGFIYPGHRDRIPEHVMKDLSQRLENETAVTPPQTDVCQGTLLSREQYLVDVERWGYGDARVQPAGELTQMEASNWSHDVRKPRRVSGESREETTSRRSGR
jgi:hypothetical protein